MQISGLLNHSLTPSLQSIEVTCFFQIPHFQIIGLPGPEIAESRERIRAAFEACSFEFPKKRIVINLSPSSIRKKGTGLDLGMALAILFSQQKVKKSYFSHLVAWGELSLDGRVRAVGQCTRAFYAAWKNQADVLILSKEETESSTQKIRQMIDFSNFKHPPPKILLINTLQEAWETLQSQELANHAFIFNATQNERTTRNDDIKFLPLPDPLLRKLICAAIGHHHILLLGAKGTGKSYALECLRHLMPPPSPSLIVEQLLFNELSEQGTTLLSQSEIKLHCPFRRIGCQVKPSALTGHIHASGVLPGEFTLAHGGILVADEFPEWPRDSRESLREPLERKKISLNRIHGSVDLPANFIFAGNGNLCPCGGLPTEFGESHSPCYCREAVKRKYLSRISGPIMDRIDILHLQEEGKNSSQPQSILKIQEHVMALREKATKQWGDLPGNLDPASLESQIKKTEFQSLVKESHDTQEDGLFRKLNLRSRHKIARIALTLSLIDEKETPELSHFYEAAMYRPERVFC